MKLSKGGTLPPSKPLKPFDGSHRLYLPAKGERMRPSPRALVLTHNEIEALLKRSDEVLGWYGFNREQLLKLNEPS